ncbi:50S ribosomal protein L20 [Patescibacteria group bacterium]|nr:50S ribosomal protein L20 [Patescibacteria group bacterium]
MVKAGQHAYEDRKLKKRDQRRLWIERMSAAIQAR